LEINTSKLAVDENAIVGSGSSAHVYRGQYDKLEVAIKMFKYSEPEKKILHEVKIMTALEHGNIVKLIGYSLNPKMIVLEYCHFGCLFDRLHTETEKRTRSKSSSRTVDAHLKDIKLNRPKIALGIARGMQYLHDIKKLSHLDLSSRNILLTREWESKIADFGISKNDSDEKYGKLGVGTTIWKAPEIYKRKRKSVAAGHHHPDRSNTYTNKVDVFSYAIILWELFHLGHFPWEMELEIEKKVLGGARPLISPDCPQKWRHLIECCWKHNPGERPDFKDIVEMLELTEHHHLEMHNG